MKPKNKPKKGKNKHMDNLLVASLADTKVPMSHRCQILVDALLEDSKKSHELAKDIINTISSKDVPDSPDTIRKIDYIDKVIEKMQLGPCRAATFVERRGLTQALVVLDDGVEAYVVIPMMKLVHTFKLGDRVLVDGNGQIIIGESVPVVAKGEVLVLERKVDERSVELTNRNDSRTVYLATQSLMDEINAGKVEQGDKIIANTHRAVAIAHVPEPENKYSHYRFLDTGPVPNVIVERDIGAPPKCIEEAANHVRLELTQSELRRRYNMRRFFTKLLVGVSGTGKTLAVNAIHRRIYDVMADYTKVPIEQLPPRVFKIRPSKIYSMWFSESEHNFDRAIEEAVQLSEEPFKTPDGRMVQLPVMIVIEEVDGIGRSRGTSEPIGERILSSILQTLDPNRSELSNRLVVLLATTNEPHLVDPALMRRVGTTVENFGRLKRDSFVAVMHKLVGSLPVSNESKCKPHIVWNEHINHLAARFYDTEGPGVVQINYSGAQKPDTKHARDFFTGALVERAVQTASAQASTDEIGGAENPGITLGQLEAAFDSQVKAIVDNLRENNVGSYTELPEGARVSMVKRVAISN